MQRTYPTIGVASVAMFFLAACDGTSPYPWENSGRPPELEAFTAAPSPSLVEVEASAREAIEEAKGYAPRGGLYVKCLQGLSAERDPVRDVTRLTTACGPSTGMVAVEPGILEGAISESAPVTFDLQLVEGRCYRVFASADPNIAELDVEVRTSRGTLAASDHQTGRLAVAQPDRPFCTFANDAATIHVTASGGTGAFALEVLSVQHPRGIDGPRHAQ